MKVKKQLPTPKKVCEKCGRTLPFSAFRRWKNQHGEGYENTCNECKQLIKDGKPIVTLEQVADLQARRIASIVHASMYCQFAIQELFTEAILDHASTIKAHRFYSKQAKQLFNKIVETRAKYEIKVGTHYDDDSVEKIDNMAEAFLQDQREQRMQIYYALANHYAKKNHPERHLITAVEYIFCMGAVLKAYRELFNKKMQKYGITREGINKFNVDVAVNNTFQLAELCRKQYHYDHPTKEEAPHLYQAADNLMSRIDLFIKEQTEDTYKFYLQAQA